MINKEKFNLVTKFMMSSDQDSMPEDEAYLISLSPNERSAYLDNVMRFMRCGKNNYERNSFLYNPGEEHKYLIAEGDHSTKVFNIIMSIIKDHVEAEQASKQYDTAAEHNLDTYNFLKSNTTNEVFKVLLFYKIDIEIQPRDSVDVEFSFMNAEDDEISHFRYVSCELLCKIVRNLFAANIVPTVFDCEGENYIFRNIEFKEWCSAHSAKETPPAKRTCVD